MRAHRVLAAFFLISLPVWSQAASHSLEAPQPLAKGQSDVLTLLIALSGTPLLPQVAASPSTEKAGAPAQAAQEENAGQRVFEQNCARCHNAPEGFSPSISGTIVRHMRVRASLSHEEEQELLQFFNP